MRIAGRNIWIGVVMAIIFVLSNIAYGAQSSDSVIITQSVANCNNDGVCDSFENYSACPNDCSAPTSTPPAVPSPPAGDGGFTERPSIRFEISDVSIDADTDSVTIMVYTNKIASVNLEWGDSMRYGNTLLSEDLKVIHKFFIDNLEADTPYYYRIRATSIDGEISEYKGAFRTKTVRKENVIFNVLDFKAIARDSDIELIWRNPEDDNFEGVRIVRSDKFFPIDPYAGKVVFEGKGDRYVDTDVEVGKVYFYTAFSFDISGNFSSGVIAQAMIVKKPAEEVVVDDEGEVVESPTLYPLFNILEVIEDSPIVSPEIDKLSLGDFDIIQRGHLIEPVKGKVIVDAEKPFKIRISYNKVPEVLKSIIVRIYKDQNKKEKVSFLLRVDDKKTEYKAMVAPLEELGIYDMEIYILDFKHRKLKVLTGSIVGVKRAGVKSGATEEIYDLEEIGVYTSMLFLSLILILMLYRIIRKVLVV